MFLCVLCNTRLMLKNYIFKLLIDKYFFFRILMIKKTLNRFYFYRARMLSTFWHGDKDCNSGKDVFEQ